jgi:hypothetical protein
MHTEASFFVGAAAAYAMWQVLDVLILFWGGVVGGFIQWTVALKAGQRRAGGTVVLIGEGGKHLPMAAIELDLA